MTLSPWAFAWVTRLYHSFYPVLFILVVISLVNLASLFKLTVLPQDFLLIVISLIAMSVAAIKLLDSFKTALLIMIFGGYVLVMLLAALNWLGIESDSNAALGWVVEITMMTSHLVHFLSALLREMARGAYQQEAISEALGLTHQPILLSSLTTVLGFVVAAYFNANLVATAWVVVVGTLISYFVVLSWLPLVLIKFFLEFRVGHYEDRHGFDWLYRWFEKVPGLVDLSQWLILAVTITAFVVLWWWSSPLMVLGWMLLSSFVLLMLFWQRLQLSVLALAFALISVSWVSAIWSLIVDDPLTALVLVVPLGIVLDDIVHFFVRYQRAERFFITQPADRVKFALTSVGRPLWLTSVLLIIGLAILSFSGQPQIVSASWVTILAVLVTSWLLLILFPATVIANRQVEK